MRLRYSTQDIFWNKDNEIKPNKNGFNNYLNSMRNATNFNVNYVSELSIKITVPVNEIWKFIEIDDEKGNKFSKRYYVLGTITKKNNINCECIFVVDIWCSFILNNFDKFMTNRTHEISDYTRVLPNHNEILVPTTKYQLHSINLFRDGNFTNTGTQLPNGLYYEEGYHADLFTSTHLTHVFYHDHEQKFYFIFNTYDGTKVKRYTNGVGSVVSDKICGDYVFRYIINNQINLPFPMKKVIPDSSKPDKYEIQSNGSLKYIVSFYGPHFQTYPNRETLDIFTDPNVSSAAISNFIFRNNPHVNHYECVKLADELVKKNVFYGAVAVRSFDIDVFKYNKRTDNIKNFLVLSNMETKYLSGNITCIFNPFYVSYFDVATMFNENFNINIDTKQPFIQDEYIKSIKSNANTFNTSLSVAKQNRDFQMEQAKAKGGAALAESIGMGAITLGTGLATSHIGGTLKGIRETIFDTVSNSVDLAYSMKGIELQYQNTLARAKAQRADIKLNSTYSVNTFDTQSINYGVSKNVKIIYDTHWKPNPPLTPATEREYNEYIWFSGDFEYAKIIYAWFGYACINYEITLSDGLDSYIRVEPTWLNIKSSYYNGLTPSEIQAVKTMLIQGVRVSTNGQIL